MSRLGLGLLLESSVFLKTLAWVRGGSTACPGSDSAQEKQGLQCPVWGGGGWG